MEETKESIKRLCDAIEEALGRSVHTPKDFDMLSRRIFDRTGELLSRNTLRRIWGRISGDVTPRCTTLDILSRFIGYSSYRSFVDGSQLDEGDSSTPFFGRRLSAVNGLAHGDRLRLTWQPGRVCDVEYNGSLHFRVIHSENTKLKEGDTFLCSLIIEGQPLYLEQLEQGNNPPTAYICGKQGGVRFEMLNE